MGYAKKNYKRRTPRKASNFRKKVAAIAKTVALRQQETKHAALSYASREVYHNNSYNIAANLINVQQGTQDHAHRIGDEITLRGIKLYMKFESKYDRPNTNFRVVVAKCRQGIAGALNLPIKVITGNATFDPVDMEQLMKVYVNRTYRFGGQNTFVDSTMGSANNNSTTHFRKVWIPLNNVKYKFLNQNVTQGTAYNIACWVAAYDAATELSTDNIGNIQIIGEVYFKDA